MKTDRVNIFFCRFLSTDRKMYNFSVCCDATDGKIKLDKRREPKHAANLGLGCTGLSAGPEAGGLCLGTHISRVPQTLVPAAVTCSTRAAASSLFSLAPSRTPRRAATGCCATESAFVRICFGRAATAYYAWQRQRPRRPLGPPPPPPLGISLASRRMDRMYPGRPGSS